MKVLVAEDDRHTREGLAEVFQSEGYEVRTAVDGEAALLAFDEFAPDVVCLDIMMPGKSGYDVCRAIRKVDEQIPVLFISAKSEEIDKVLGLELDADDFIVKPFGVKEVVARIRAVTRRAIGRKPDIPETFAMLDLKILPAELRAQRGETVIELSLRDIQVLSCLFGRAQQVVSRDTLFNEVWGYEHMPNSRTLDQHISTLRRKIEIDPKQPLIIQTVHGVGYRYLPTAVAG